MFENSWAEGTRSRDSSSGWLLWQSDYELSSNWEVRLSGAGGSSGTCVLGVVIGVWSTELAQSLKETEQAFQALVLMLCFGGLEILDTFHGCTEVWDTIFWEGDPVTQIGEVHLAAAPWKQIWGLWEVTMISSGMQSCWSLSFNFLYQWSFS